MESRTNTILKETADPVFDLERLTGPMFYRKKITHKKDIRDLRRTETARQAIAGWDKTIEIHGFTKAQFSLIDLVEAVLEIIGPAKMFLSTWTAANTDVTRVLHFCQSAQVLESRWLVDLTFQKRQPQLAQRIRNTFGADAIRVGKNHAKFVILYNDQYDVIINTSMNLNFNPRFENFTLKNDPELCKFYLAIAEEVWSRQARTLADDRPGEIIQFFNREM